MRRGTPAGRGAHGEGGYAVLVALLILLAIVGSSLSFLWVMNRLQARAGARLRLAAAMGVAEAGVHRALAALETVAPDGGSPGRSWRPSAYSEVVQVGPLEGRFTLSLADEAGGAIVITSAGEVAGVTRRLRARVYLASPAQLVGLYGASLVRLEDRPGAIFILPYGAAIGDRPWIHIAAGRGIWFATAEVAINDPSVPFDAGPGPVDGPQGANAATVPPSPGP
ncbi:MAG: hypothetical protein HY355_06040, partial [Armatimonadetes bacterium]|nr:hypothetical protein [Armatimonadota bacterium]